MTSAGKGFFLSKAMAGSLLVVEMSEVAVADPSFSQIIFSHVANVSSKSTSQSTLSAMRLAPSFSSCWSMSIPVWQNFS